MVSSDSSELILLLGSPLLALKAQFVLLVGDIGHRPARHASQQIGVGAAPCPGEAPLYMARTVVPVGFYAGRPRFRTLALALKLELVALARRFRLTH